MFNVGLNFGCSLFYFWLKSLVALCVSSKSWDPELVCSPAAWQVMSA